MQYRNLGRSGLKISPICLGTMMFGGPTDEATSSRIVAKAREAGVNFIDTADAYNGGNSEADRRPRDRKQPANWILATKLANPIGDDPNHGGLSRRWVLQAADDSLRRLGTDFIDIYYLHKEDHATPLAETVRAIGDLVRAGQDPLFRRLQLPRLAHRRDLQHLRPARHRPPDREPALLQRHEPHARGRAFSGLRLLRPRHRALQPAGARRADRQISRRCRARQGHARGAQRQAHDADRVAAGIARGLRRRSSTTPRHAASPPGQFAVAWVLNSAFVSGVIGGPRTEEQWDDYIKAIDYRFTAEDEALIDRLVAPGHPSTPGFNDPAYPIEGRRARTAV